ncbi:conserved hypothetical protein [Solidesulfovibrio fructosivorans JJ]]|uniref:Uncharacterized protein n=1 Tax=Solidesulfovibrio fructosivorans JJ] TaxID=596151 RepID=E1JQZ9_SOLFR|nr:hypothetical protein [Solidesulfovibrio fructosivorans]EFL53000.1 conserved hypothetical protein [Solidesulfovibrio fructosivorans JJ]]
MARLLAWPNRLDAPEVLLSGGNWAIGLENLQDMRLSKVSRSGDLDMASTRFRVDFGVERTIQAVAVIGHNADLDGRVRLTGYNDADFSDLAYDSGWLDLYPPLFSPSDLEWEDENWWSGRISSEDLGEDVRTYVRILEQQFLRYWQWEFDNRTNPAGYLDIGRVFMGPGWVPAGKMTRTPTLAAETDTVVVRSLAGSIYSRRRKSRRVAQFRIERMDQVEGTNRALRLALDRGLDRDILVCLDTDEELLGQQWSLYGILRNIDSSPLEFSGVEDTAMNFQVEQITG